MARLIAVVVALLALQASSDALSIMNPLDTLITAFNTKVTDVVSKLSDGFDVLENKFLDVVDKVVLELHDGLRYISTHVQDEINATIAKFQADGQKVDECDKEISDEGQKILDSISNTVENCVGTQINDVSKTITNLGGEISNISNTMPTMQRDMDACGNIIFGLSCRNNVLALATEKFSTASLAILAEITSASARMPGLGTNIASCQDNVALNVSSQLEALNVKAMECYTN